MRHCIQNLMTDDMIVLPAAATVYCQAVEARTSTVCGFDLSSANRYRWHPAHTSGAALPLTGTFSATEQCISPGHVCLVVIRVEASATLATHALCQRMTVVTKSPA
jgi:hypothetical protein